MPDIADIGEAKKLRDRLATDHKEIIQYRQVRDRNNPAVASIKAAAPERLRDSWVEFQSQAADDEIQARKHVLASNAVEIEVVSKTSDSKVVRLAQQLEEALEALHDALFPVERQLDECDGFLADGLTYVVLDKLDPGDAIGAYADRQALETAATSGTEPDEQDQSPQAVYKRAYQSAKGDHEKAYAQVTADAMAKDGLRWRLRIPDPKMCDGWRGPDGELAVWMEDGEMELHPAISLLSRYGIKVVGDRLVLARDGKPTDEDAIGADAMAIDGSLSVTAERTKVRYTQLRTLDETIILVDVPAGEVAADGDGIMIRTKNPYGGEMLGVWVIEGDTRLRGSLYERCKPVVLGALIHAQLDSVLGSLALSMASEEATRDVVATNVEPAVPPLDGTQSPRARIATDAPVPVVGDIKRLDSTGLSIPDIMERFREMGQRYNMTEFFTGSGSAGETGIYLARLQTAYQTRLQPYQTKRAQVHKKVLQAVMRAVQLDGQTVYIDYLPNESRGAGQDIRVAKPREITPEMAALPVDIRMTIGAESPESKYAAIQMSQSQWQIGTWGMTQHRENSGVKDPTETEFRLAEDMLVASAIGSPQTGPGWVLQMVRDLSEQQIRDYIASLLPQPLPQPAPPVDPNTGQPMGGPPPAGPPPPGGMPPDMGAPPADMGGQGPPPGPNNGPAYVPPPTQIQTGGVPVVSGVPGVPT